MLAGLSPSLSTAIRTAGEARQRSDTMARQIATGKEVASARDGGARYAQALALKSQRTDWVNTVRNAEWNQASVGYQLSASETLEGPMREVRAALLQLSTPGQSASSRAAHLRAASRAWELTGNAWTLNTYGILGDPGSGVITANLRTPDGTVISSTGWLGHPAQIGIQSTAGSIQTNQNGFGQVQWDTATNLLVIPDEAAARSAIAFIDSVMPLWRNEVAAQGNSIKLAERFERTGNAAIDRIDRAIGGLTDADLGKASAARAQADTRQQLALQTVRTALNAYGAFAGDLLSNVQRTQRALA